MEALAAVLVAPLSPSGDAKSQFQCEVARLPVPQHLQRLARALDLAVAYTCTPAGTRLCQLLLKMGKMGGGREESGHNLKVM